MLDVLRELAEATEFPVLVALDDFNQCYQLTGYHYDGERVRPEQLTLVNAFRFFQPATDNDDDGASRSFVFAPKNPMRNGVVLAAESHHRVITNKEKKQYQPVWKAITRAAPGRVNHTRYNLGEVRWLRAPCHN